MDAKHTPTPWFVSGVRFKMNGGEWQSVNRYDEAKKLDENIACVGYDPRTGLGFADAHFIVRAANSHAALIDAVKDLIGLCQLIRNRDDIPAEVRQALTHNHRIIAGYEALSAAGIEGFQPSDFDLHKSKEPA